MNNHLCKLRVMSLFTLILFFLLISLPQKSAADSIAKSYSILVINSYSQGLTWTAEETRGIIDTLRKSDMPMQIAVEDMDRKNYPQKASLDYLSEYYSYKYHDKKIDMIITTDDAALSFALAHRKEIFGDAPVVFCGVNRLGARQIIVGKKNVTGVLESLDAYGTANIGKRLLPDVRKAYVVYDGTQSGRSTGELAMEGVREAGLEAEAIGGKTHEDTFNSISRVTGNSIIVLTSYYQDSNGESMDFETFASRASRFSSVPVFHLLDFGVGRGVVGGSVVGGRIQGENAAKIALEVLQGRDINSIAVSGRNTHRMVFDYAIMQKYNMDPGLLDEGSIIINKPFSFIETYHDLVISTAIVFIALLGFICILIFFMQRLRIARKQLDAINSALRISDERFSLATEGAKDTIWDIDMLTHKNFFSIRWYDMLGYAIDDYDIENGEWIKLVHPEDEKNMRQKSWEHLRGDTPYYDCEYRLLDKTGVYRWFLARGKALFDINGRPLRFAGSLTEITQRKMSELKLRASNEELEAANEELLAMEEALHGQYDELVQSNQRLEQSEERLRHLAYHDNLTDLSNMRQLRIDFQEACVAQGKVSTALFFLDGDNFKYINDTLGHPIGDQLINMIAKRILDAVNDRGKVYRIGGDEFAIVIQDIDRETAQLRAADIVGAFAKAFAIDHSKLYVSVSVGIAMYPEDGCDFDELFKFSDIAMYRAKDAGKGRYVLFDKDMADNISRRVELEANLRHALENGELSLVFQPQVNVSDDSILGFEALLRWNSPQLGNVSPSEFIKVAEDSRQIIEIGAWVMESAVRFVAEINYRYNRSFTIAVNVSVLQLMQADYVESLMTILDSTGLSPKCLELEITESILMESYEVIGGRLNQLREQGVCVALDDFGKGYSSLSYLTVLPIDILKVDKSFIDDINLSSQNAMTGSIISIGQRMGLQIVAEGVETKLQLDYLRENGCDRFQGYLFSRALPAQQIVSLYLQTS